ncbi:MAG: DNA-3-methyladenine glycosylase [bacterium]|nr:DNA-3-methyladenine glycosylase [bacterium]
MVGKVLPPSFYNRAPDVVARELLGAIVVHEVCGTLCSGRIVETEAYFAEDDPACHAWRGKTRRNAIMFGPPGHAYVYFCYGNHWLLNAVTEGEGRGSAVLIRALEPLTGIEMMQARRGGVRLQELTNGPGKLCAALGITGRHNGLPLYSGSLRIHAGEGPAPRWEVGPRIGIRVGTDILARFYIAEHPCVSRRA